jgi:seryl-tRNA synthetase
MAEDKNINKTDEQDEKDQGSATAESKKAENELMIPKDRFDEINEKYKALSKEIEAKEKALRKAQEERLKEQEDYKRLYEETASRLSELEPKAEQLDAVLETMEALLEAEVQELPEDLRDIIPDELSVKAKLDWLRKHKAKLVKPVGPDIGAGQRGAGSSGSVTVTPEIKRGAETFGLSEEQMKKAAKRLAEKRNQ